MAKAIIYLPYPPQLECGGNMTKNLEMYFKTIGSTVSQLKMQSSFVEGNCGNEVINAIIKIEAIIDEVTGILGTDVFTTFKNKVDEMEYKCREFMKDIDVWIQKKIVEAAVKLLSIIGIPNPLKMPIPFMSSITLIDDQGNPYQYRPVIADMFTKDGKKKVKAALRETVDDIKKFFSDDPTTDVYAGEWNIKSLDYQVEELWQKLMHEINKILNTTIIDLINGIFKILSKIPVIGSLIKALGMFVDPTKSLDQAFKEMWNNAKKKYQEIRDKIVSGEFADDLVDSMQAEANKIIDTLIDDILGIQVPIFGSLGKILGIDPDIDFKKYKIKSKEKILGRIRDGWNDLMEKIKKFLATGWIVEMYKLVMKVPGFILKRFPIIGKIISFCEAIVDVMTGKIDMCFVMNAILPSIFDLSDLVTKSLPNCIEIRYAEYGFMPSMTDQEQNAEGDANAAKADNTPVDILPKSSIPTAVPTGTTVTDGNGKATSYSDSKVTLGSFNYSGDTLNSYIETEIATAKKTLYTFSGTGDNVTTTTTPVLA